MARDEHAPYLENIPAYAIGALDAEDVAALEAHLKTCASCRTELAEYRAVSASLLTATPPKQPSAALRKRLPSRLPSAQKSTRPQWTFSFSNLALGLAVIALLVLNIFSFVQLRQIQSQQASLLNQVENAQIALAMLSSPNIQTVLINGENVSGTILLDKDHNQAFLIVGDLPALANDQIYQIWLVKPDGGRDSAGLFRPATGQSYTTKAISSTQMLSSYLGMGVTVEPAGGSAAPTGERVFKVDF
jgi:anti-sigma-K factor RskA